MEVVYRRLLKGWEQLITLASKEAGLGNPDSSLPFFASSHFAIADPEILGRHQMRVVEGMLRSARKGVQRCTVFLTTEGGTIEVEAMAADFNKGLTRPGDATLAVL